jgi:hypothetical protein
MKSGAKRKSRCAARKKASPQNSKQSANNVGPQLSQLRAPIQSFRGQVNDEKPPQPISQRRSLRQHSQRTRKALNNSNASDSAERCYCLCSTYQFHTNYSGTEVDTNHTSRWKAFAFMERIGLHGGWGSDRIMFRRDGIEGMQINTP